MVKQALATLCMSSILSILLYTQPTTLNQSWLIFHSACLCFWVSSGPGDEAKLFLWWHKALNLSAEQLQPQSGQTEVSGVVMGLQRLEARLLQMGEERLNSGLLGAIGLGKRSPVSNRYIHVGWIRTLV